MTRATTSRFMLLPTFPLDSREIRRRTLLALARHPVTWGPGLAVCGVSCLLGLSPLVTVFLTALAIAGSVVTSMVRLPKTEDQVVRGLIVESNAAQNRDLADQAALLRRRGYSQYARVLDHFVALKKHIEQCVHAEGAVAVRSEKMDNLADALCSMVCRQLFEAAKLDARIGQLLLADDAAALQSCERRRAELHEGIRAAYIHVRELACALAETRGDSARTRSRAAKEGGSGQDSDLVARLRDECARVQRMRTRLESLDSGPRLAGSSVVRAQA